MSYVLGPRSYEVGTGGVESFRIVQLDGEKVILNSAAGTPIGFATTYAAEGERVSVQHLGVDGTWELETAGAVSALDLVFAADEGRIQILPSEAGTYRKIGIALKSAASAGEIIEVLPYDFHATVTVT
ncbi:DUF2190 family protein [Desulfobotulus sp. H1]|uniref:DUF2190 family protein n=1 Tax=Desulfobotulus pelophilus TaxID=2823377 RepID=A0ABT3NDF3_9BACT|nr:DUF2190 family protein [Desulfobotulus pelophilus]MCW7755495.1 DUF2190 family protein [Desulfobotulus pelophilus]